MKIHLRKATLLDAERLLQWRNDELSILHSLSQQEVAKNEHIAWLSRILLDTKVSLYIAENEEEEPVGSIRLENKENYFLLSWVISPASRGKGYGKLLLKEVFRTHQGIFVAQIKISNTASLRMAEFAGMKKVRIEGDVSTWEIQIFL